MTKRLAFLGPPGTHSEVAALSFDAEATLVPYESIPAVAASVDSGLADEGVVPIENSREGPVTSTVDLLIHESTLLIRSELVLPIEHSLLAVPGTSIEEITVIYSHPQALAQCRSFVEKRLPKVALVASLSTAAAVEEMQRNKATAGAIATRRAAVLYGAEVLAQGIEDSPDNATRFVVLAKSDHPPTGSDKTSICFDFEHDAPGILFSVLEELAKRGINLAKIESRPTKRSLGRYIFLVDMEGHRDDPILREALEAVRAQVTMFKILGSYPIQVSSAVG